MEDMTDNSKIKPFEIPDEEPVIKSKWVRAKVAQEYFSICRNTLDKIATQCDAKKKIGDRLNVYNLEQIERYISTQ